MSDIRFKPQCVNVCDVEGNGMQIFNVDEMPGFA